MYGLFCGDDGDGVCEKLFGLEYVIGGRWCWLEVGYFCTVLALVWYLCLKFLKCHYVGACGILYWRHGCYVEGCKFFEEFFRTRFFGR